MLAVAKLASALAAWPPDDDSARTALDTALTSVVITLQPAPRPPGIARLVRGRSVRGSISGVVFRVTLDDCRPLDPRLDLARKSPAGFEWGYEGSGPAQLALALLADVTTDEIALARFQDFKRQRLAAIDSDSWCMSRYEVLEWAGSQ